MEPVFIGVGLLVFAIFLLIASSFFSVRTQTAAVIERFGKFVRVAGPGLNFKLPFVDSRHTVDLSTLQLIGSIDTKTKDNVFVTLPVNVQYRILNNTQSISDAYYKLSSPKSQIESYLYNIILGHIPDTNLDDLFLTQPAISMRATSELSTQMQEFGYEIVKVLITDIVPDSGVKAAMNSINEQTRKALAFKAQGDAEYILKVRRAEADAEVKRLEGVGVAKEREAIADGWKEAINAVKASTTLSDEAASFLLLFTNWTDMMRVVGSSTNSTVVFMPSGPEGLQNFQQTMTNVLLTESKPKLAPRSIPTGMEATS